MKNLPIIILVGLYCLFLAFRDMWLSTKGEDIVSQTKKKMVL